MKNALRSSFHLGDTEIVKQELETFLELYWDRAYVREYKANAEALLAELRGEL